MKKLILFSLMVAMPFATQPFFSGLKRSMVASFKQFARPVGFKVVTSTKWAPVGMTKEQSSPKQNISAADAVFYGDVEGFKKALYLGADIDGARKNVDYHIGLYENRNAIMKWLFYYKTLRTLHEMRTALLTIERDDAQAEIYLSRRATPFSTKIQNEVNRKADGCQAWKSEMGTSYLAGCPCEKMIELKQKLQEIEKN